MRRAAAAAEVLGAGTSGASESGAVGSWVGRGRPGLGWLAGGAEEDEKEAGRPSGGRVT